RKACKPTAQPVRRSIKTSESLQARLWIADDRIPRPGRRVSGHNSFQGMTLKRLRTVEVLGVLLLGLAVAPAAALAQTGTITGVVLERGNGQPVAGAEVRVEATNATTSTNAVGRFQLQEAPPRRATLT